MRGIFITFTLAALLVAGPSAQRPQDVAFQAAVRTESVTGDLKAAIKQYEQIVATYGKTDRGVAVKALLRMAELYQKIGATEARTIWERIVREFPDQRAEVATARARLAPSSTPHTTDDRVVWSGNDVPEECSMSPDGRFIAYVDEETGDLGLRTVGSGAMRKITTTASWDKDMYAETPAFSRDGKQIAYVWSTGAGGKTPLQLRIVSVTPAGAGEPRTVAEFDDRQNLEVFDWAPDGSRILVQIYTGRASDLAFITSKGARQPLKNIGAGGATRARVSPDGSLVAFDAPAKERAAQFDVFVIRTDGSGETRVATGPAHDTVAGWSDDGRRLLYMSDAGGGTSHLMAQEIAKGQPQGKAEILRRNVRGEAFGVTAAGSAFVYAVANDQAIHTATVDFVAGRLLGKPVAKGPGLWSRSRQPKWSRDGRQFAAIASTRAGAAGRLILTIYAGDDLTRALHLPLVGIWTYDWSPDGKSFLARATDLEGRHGIFQIDAQTGDASPVMLNNPPAHPQASEFTNAPARMAYFLPHWSADGTTFYFAKGGDGTGGGGMLERHLTSGEERVRYEVRNLKTADGSVFSGMRDQVVSPDGKFAAGFSLQPESVLWVVSLADRSVREVHRIKRRNAFTANALLWTPDSKVLVLNVNPDTFATPKYDGRGHELWAVPIAGGNPVKLDVGVDNLRGEAVAIHPDGRQIAFVAGDRPTSEIRVLENVIPKASGRRGRE